MRKIIAKRLSESKSTIPHVYSTIEIILDQVMEIRASLNGLVLFV